MTNFICRVATVFRKLIRYSIVVYFRFRMCKYMLQIGFHESPWTACMNQNACALGLQLLAKRYGPWSWKVFLKINL